MLLLIRQGPKQTAIACYDDFVPILLGGAQVRSSLIDLQRFTEMHTRTARARTLEARPWYLPPSGSIVLFSVVLTPSLWN